MKQPTLLNLNGSWENIVNNVERHNARLRFEQKLYQRKLKKKISRVAELALCAILSVVLGVAGILAPWFACSAAVLLACAACLFCGRVWEGYRR